MYNHISFKSHVLIFFFFFYKHIVVIFLICKTEFILVSSYVNSCWSCTINAILVLFSMPAYFSSTLQRNHSVPLQQDWRWWASTDMEKLNWIFKVYLRREAQLCEAMHYCSSMNVLDVVLCAPQRVLKLIRSNEEMKLKNCGQVVITGIVFWKDYRGDLWLES